jgi:DNA-binding transcriptional regulator YiaG
VTPAQIQAALNQIGLTQQQGARLFRHNERTIRRWIAGDVGVPQGIAILLQMLVDDIVTVADMQRTANKLFN